MKRGNIRKFARTTDQRRAFLRSLATALITHGRITTTKARAKVTRTYVEKLLTMAKQQSVARRRELRSQIGTEAVSKLVDTIAPQHASRAGGYTRIIQLSRRNSDGAEMAILEFVQ